MRDDAQLAPVSYENMKERELKMNSYITKPTVAGIVAILCWSVTIAFAKSSSDSIGPITTSAIINLLGSLGGIIYLLIRNRSIITNTTKAYSFICGLLFIYYMLAIFMAVGSTKSVVDAGTIGLINYLWIPLTIVFSVIFNKVPYKKTLYLGLVVFFVWRFLCPLHIACLCKNWHHPEIYFPHTGLYLPRLLGPCTMSLQTN
ncbi:hypothetical protein E4P82_01660 [Candidatus Competibacter phosphatis]|uniref:EamA domain-containing protein n=1 Tax=Candidatus Competibacter phosphatis TaxID=221280 RepID=A0ABX1TGX1_9GAMM|nr:hypothetical protein [Candidatus Competibacter phosphatis]